MKKSFGGSLEERRSAAAESKLKLLERFKLASKTDDPKRLAKRAEREAIAAAREVRQEANAIKLVQEKAEAAARELAEAAAHEAELARRAEQAVADEAERKAERDRRYAARKKR
ncbi:MAG TPA: DUF6481 family protein [Thermohalobaculum sp.]|nr:DUF6481 family protein [Thermohalobaculum sp.]